jgi:hypothetical protein
MIRFPQAKRVIVVVRWAPAFLIAVALCAATFWLWAVPLRWYFLKSDDFFYIGWSRTAIALRDHLVTPFHGHVVPLYLVETHLLARLAGSMESLPAVLGFASYATVVLAMAATGHLVAWETGRPACGLAAMAAVGLTSVLGPTLLWYAAGQALGAGTMIVVMLAALQAWRARGSRWWLAPGLLALIAAPLLWTAGYIAGLVGMAYLWADGRRGCRRVGAILPLISAAQALLVWCVAGRGFAPSSQVVGRSLINSTSAGAMVMHTVQAICEAMVLNNLGLDAATTAGQAIVLGALLFACWAVSRHRTEPAGSGPWPRLNPLEAAGAVLVVASFGIIFVVRGIDYGFESLRGMGWYDAIAELGTVLFVAGWWSGPLDSPPPRSIEPPRRFELLVLALFVAAMLLLQLPRVDRVIFLYDGAAAPYGPSSPIVVEPVTLAKLAARARTQRQALAALDRIERSARERGTRPAEVRRAVGEVSVPAMPELSLNFDAVELLDLPANSADPD